jgi:hypothetical protein
MHSRNGSKGTFEPTAFAREIQRLTDLMESILVDECAGKGCGKSGILSDYHDSALFCGPAARWFCCSQGSHYADVMPSGFDDDCPFTHGFAGLKFDD